MTSCAQPRATRSTLSFLKFRKGHSPPVSYVIRCRSRARFGPSPKFLPFISRAFDRFDEKGSGYLEMTGR